MTNVVSYLFLKCTLGERVAVAKVIDLNILLEVAIFLVDAARVFLW